MGSKLPFVLLGLIFACCYVYRIIELQLLLQHPGRNAMSSLNRSDPLENIPAKQQIDTTISAIFRVEHQKQLHLNKSQEIERPEHHSISINSSSPEQIPYIAVVISSAATYVSRLLPILRTWGRFRQDFYFIVVIDQPLPLEIAGHVFVFKESAGHPQRRWPLGLTQLLNIFPDVKSVLSKVEWVFVLDDDAFLDHRHVQRLLRTLSPHDRTIYGQRCHLGQFCGGAGWLAHRSVLEQLIPAATSHCGVGSEPYDICFSRVMLGIGLNLTERGEFCSQPPSFYTPVDPFGSIRDKERSDLRQGMEFAVTFHYIVGLYDEIQERIDSDRPLWPW